MPQHLHQLLAGIFVVPERILPFLTGEHFEHVGECRVPQIVTQGREEDADEILGGRNTEMRRNRRRCASVLVIAPVEKRSISTEIQIIRF
jgi:hypothetical protein